MPSKIEDFFNNLQHDDSVEDQIQQSGIINSYILTTKSAMNARRDANLCLWCNENWSINHNCENAFEFNCMFTFGEEGEGVALVVVSNDALKRPRADVVHDSILAPVANRTFHECCEQGSPLSEEEAQVSDALQVFDEIPRHEVWGECVEAVNKQNDTLVAVVHKVFDETPEPILSSNALVLPTRDENGLIDETGELAVGSYEDFESTYELAECNIRHTRHESFEIRQRMIAKLSKLETPYFHDLVIIGAHSERFSTLTSVLHNCRVSDEITRDTNKLCGLIFQVKSKSFVALSGIHSIDFAISSVWPSLVNNVNIIWMKSQYKCFDPGVGMIKLRFFHNITLEDKGVLRGEKKIHVKYIMKLSEVVVPSSNCVLSRSKNGIILVNFIFDPGGSQRQNDFEAMGNGYIRAHESISWLYYLNFHSQSTHNTSRTRDIIPLVDWVFYLRRYLSVHTAGDTQNALSAAFALTSPEHKHAPATFTWHSMALSFDSGIIKTSNVDVCESSTFVFDPGGDGYGPNRMSGPQESHCGSKRPKVLRYKNHQTYVFDPGGLVMIYESNDVTKPSSKYVLSVSFRLLVFFDP